MNWTLRSTNPGSTQNNCHEAEKQKKKKKAEKRSFPSWDKVQVDQDGLQTSLSSFLIPDLESASSGVWIVPSNLESVSPVCLDVYTPKIFEFAAT